MLSARLSRRNMLQTGTVVAAAGFLGTAAVTAADGTPAEATPAGQHGRPRPLLGFDPVPAGSADTVAVPEGYSVDVLIPWGTPIRSGAIVVQSPDRVSAVDAVTALLNHALRTIIPLAGWQIATVEVRDLRASNVAKT